MAIVLILCLGQGYTSQEGGQEGKLAGVLCGVGVRGGEARDASLLWLRARHAPVIGQQRREVGAEVVVGEFSGSSAPRAAARDGLCKERCSGEFVHLGA
jgi:hypothetical protein